MLQALSDLFLVISSDTKKITNQDLSIFYNFIIKKIPQIEQQYPLIISKILNDNININEYKINKDKDTKKLFIHFQKQIFNLYTELIYFCFKEGIIKLNNKILQENILIKVGFNNNKQSNDNELQKFLIYLVINNKVNCIIYPNEYIKFFNIENKRRIIAERFMKFIKQMIIIYKESKKHYNIKRIINTEKKISNTEKKLGLNNRLNDDNKNILSLTKINDNKNNSSQSDKSIIMNNSAENSIEEDEENDTLCCNTPKNISINDYKDKNINNNKFNNQNKNNLNYSSQRNTYYISLTEKNKFNVINDNLINKNSTNYNNYINDKITHNNSYINKSQNFIFHNNNRINNNYNNYEFDAGCNIN